MFGIGLARISLLTGSSLGGGVGISATLDLNFRGQGYSAAMAGYTFNQLISFTRTSAATYVNSAGNIVSTPASKNLLTFTEEFDNAAWAKTRASVTANSVAAPDGLMTADKLVEDTSASNTHFTGQSYSYTSGVTYTLSVYAKPGERNWLFVQIPAAIMGTVRNASFNLSAGSLGTVTAGVTAAIVLDNDGWYRCSVTFTTTASATASAVIALANADNSSSYTGDGTSGLYLWGAQLEVGSTATSYVRNFGGLFPPRFDYDPVTLQPRGLRIEEQRTNLLLRSEEFDNASWTKVNATITANIAVSPDGTMDADKLIATVANSQHRVDFATTSAAATHAFSVYAKPAGYNVLFIRLGMNGGYVNLSDGTISGVTSGYTLTATPAGNGWYRVVLVGAAALNEVVRINVTETATSDFAGDGTSGIFIWGAQLEAGSFATSYIPTVASQVTRTADQASIVAPNFAPWYNQSEGTFVSEVTLANTPATATFSLYAVSDNTANERVFVGTGVGSGGNINALVTDGGVTQAQTVNGSLSAAGTYKYANVYKLNDFASVVNGGAAETDTSGTVPTVDRLYIGAGALGTAQLNGHIRRIAYYPSRLSNAQLQALSA